MDGGPSMHRKASSSISSWLFGSAAPSNEEDHKNHDAPSATEQELEDKAATDEADTSFMSTASSMQSLYEDNTQLLPLVPTPAHLSTYLNPTSPVSDDDKRQVFTKAFLEAASAGSAEVIEWLLSTPSTSTNIAAARRLSKTELGAATESYREENLPDSAPRKWVNLDARDADGNTTLCLAVALGHAEAVRALVEGGVNIAARDNAGWTALHWAVQNNDLPIAAYLLNHRAPPDIASKKGLLPRDLVVRGSTGVPMRDILHSAEDAWNERLRQAEGKDETGSRAKPTGGQRREDTARAKALRKRMELAMESVQNLNVDFAMLGLEGPKSLEHDTDTEDNDDGDLEDMTFDWDNCKPEQMLVCTQEDLTVLFETVITRAKPNRIRKFRQVPANVIFLCTRYAHYYGATGLLRDVCLGAVERMEAAVHKRADDMANCSYWLSNALLLLYYFRKEKNVAAATSEEQGWLADLINEVFVIVIRDAEKRIDKIMEAAMLEHESVEGFEDVEFGDEWASTRFVKKLTGRSKKTPVKPPNVRTVFPANDAMPDSPSRSVPPSPLRANEKPSQRSSPDEADPETITSILSSTLFILQIYEIPPCIIVQAFSQLFYWISCEVFNRLLGSKKLLSRSKALQIRMNVTVLEEWARLNRMPPNLVAVHFLPLNQLLQWLQCLSSESSAEGIKSTVATLHALNPLQLRRAARDYRHEVDESKMSAECEQYLQELLKEWEQQQNPKTAEAGAEKNHVASAGSEVVSMIDNSFSDASAFGSYKPPNVQENRNEMLNSRAMLPFALPSIPEMLVNIRHKDAFGPLAGEEVDGSTSFKRSRQSSVSTTSSVDSLADADTSIVPDEPHEIVPVLPDDFWEVMDRVKASLARARAQAQAKDGSVRRPKKQLALVAALKEPIELKDTSKLTAEKSGDPEKTPRPPSGAFA